jgi:magnesium-transporting ATPase (P-type)
MSTVVKGYDGNSGNTTFLKGASDRVLDKCNKINLSSGAKNLSASDKENLKKIMSESEAKGLRVLGLAYSPTGGNMSDLTKDNKTEMLSSIEDYDRLEGNLTFLGFACIKDPCRPEVKGAIADCKMAGISVIMITGDAKATAIAIAKEIGIIEEG